MLFKTFLMLSFVRDFDIAMETRNLGDVTKRPDHN